MVTLRQKAKPEKQRIARWMRKHPTKAEDTLWQELRKNKLGVRFHRQTIVMGWIVDFYCSRKKLVIEIDGDSHKGSKAKAYDLVRKKTMKEILGLKTIRFKNKKVLNDLDGVIRIIRDNLK